MKIFVKNKRTLSLLLAFLILAPLILSTPISAHNAYYIATTIDVANKKVVAEVMYDEVSDLVNRGWLSPKNLGQGELKHKENQLFNVADSYDDTFQTGTKRENPPLYYTFPPGMRKKPGSDKVLMEPLSADAKRASEAASTLTSSLNKLLYDMLYYNTGRKTFNTVEEFEKYLREVAALKQVNRKTLGLDKESGDSVNIPGSSSLSVGRLNSGKAGDARKYIVLNTREGKKYYLFEIIKGYKSPKLEDGSPSYLVDSGNQWEDTDTLNLGDIAYQALLYSDRGIFSSNLNEVKKPGVIERKVVEFLGSILVSIKSTLGLYSIEELVFSEGDRDPNAGSWYMGAVRTDWMEKGIGFFMIFTAIAASFSGIIIMRLLYKRVLEANNPMVQFTLKRAMMEFLTAMLFMGLCMPVFNTLLRINYRLSLMFRSTVPQGFTAVGSVGGEYQTIGGLIIGFIWLVIEVILNAQFLIRSIMIAFLISIAPLAIISIAVEDGRRRTFGTWSRELVANIFLQSFQAFVLSFFLNIQNSGRMIESIIVTITIIPLSQFFKNLLIGDAGGSMKMGSGLGKLGIGTGVAGAIGLASGAMGGVKEAYSRFKGSDVGSIGGTKSNDPPDLGGGGSGGGGPDGPPPDDNGPIVGAGAVKGGEDLSPGTSNLRAKNREGEIGSFSVKEAADESAPPRNPGHQNIFAKTWDTTKDIARHPIEKGLKPVGRTTVKVAPKVFKGAVGAGKVAKTVMAPAMGALGLGAMDAMFMNEGGFKAPRVKKPKSPMPPHRGGGFVKPPTNEEIKEAFENENNFKRPYPKKPASKDKGAFNDDDNYGKARSKRDASRRYRDIREARKLNSKDTELNPNIENPETDIPVKGETPDTSEIPVRELTPEEYEEIENELGYNLNDVDQGEVYYSEKDLEIMADLGIPVGDVDDGPPTSFNEIEREYLKRRKMYPAQTAYSDFISNSKRNVNPKDSFSHYTGGDIPSMDHDSMEEDMLGYAESFLKDPKKDYSHYLAEDKPVETFDNKGHILDMRKLDDSGYLPKQWKENLPADRKVYRNFVEEMLKKRDDYDPKKRTDFEDRIYSNNDRADMTPSEILEDYTNRIERSMGFKEGTFDSSKLTYEDGLMYEDMLFKKYGKK